MMLTLIYALAWSFADPAAGKAAPPADGAVVIMFDSVGGKACSDRVTEFPAHTVQYWYNGGELWRVSTTGYEATVSAVSVTTPADWRAIDAVVRAIEGQKYDCRFSANFIPDDPGDIEKALLGLSFRIGRVKKKAGVWYWAR
jgi:hypothetical protein